MADAAVGFLLTTLKELLDEHSQLIKNTADYIRNMQQDLGVFYAFLQDSVEKRRKNDKVTEQKVQQIRNVVYKMEDIIDTYVNKIKGKKNSSILHKYLKKPFDLHSIGQEVRTVSQSIKEARDGIGIITQQHHNNTSHKYKERPPRKKDVVGFVDVFKDLKERLLRETEHFEVTFLIGMFGLGKTTLAWKIFQDPDIIHKFPNRHIWLDISQEFKDRDIFLRILLKLTTVTDDIKSKKDHELADLIKAYLEIESFLIVMDDVWEPHHWRRLEVVLPDNNNRGKVLITSRNESVGKGASQQKHIKTLRHFNDEESWELLKLEALHSRICPTELEDVGRTIAAKCKKLSLAVVIIGGILALKYNSDLCTMKKDWVDVSNKVTTYLNENDPEKRMENFISLSFDNLPYDLHSCFLYLGMFPEDYEIPVSKLIRLWIAEGFIQKKESCSLEETAQQHLEELINRNLLKIEKFRHNNKVKTCRIHDTVRDFCRTGAANENLLKEIKFVEGNFDPPVSEIDKYRRLAVHSNCLGFISQKPSCPHARSFVCFSKDKYNVSEENSANMFAAFKFLKVLDVKPFVFEKIDIFQLVYMKYLVLSTNLSILPSKFSQLWNLQTVMIETSSRTLEVQADIWKMKSLRYFKTKASAILPQPGKGSEHGKELETLSTISVGSCTAELLRHASNMKKLGVRGDLGILLDGRLASFDSFGKSGNIEKLKLIHDVYPDPSRDKPLRGLPRSQQFPSGLTSLTLAATFLSWGVMYILGELRNLEVLKLKEKAFMGAIWTTVDEGFKRLRLLHIEDTDLIMWNASPLHYPQLRSVVLRNCKDLVEVPIGLANISSFHTLELYACKSAADSAKAIKEAKKSKQAGSPFSLLMTDQSSQG